MNKSNRWALVGFLLAFFLAFVLTTWAMDKAEGAEPCVPSPETTEVVVVTPAVPATEGTPDITEEVFDHWQRYSWNGPWESDTEAPPFPDDRWQPNVQGDPHGIGVEGPYFRSHGNSGNGDWFYLESVERTIVIPGTPGTPEIPAVTETIVHPAVVCETPTETPTFNPSDQPTIQTEVNVEITTNDPHAPSGEPTMIGDPVVQTETKNEPHKMVKIYTHESGKITRTVKHYPVDAKEEGL